MLVPAFSAERLHHQQAPGLSVCGAEPPQSVLQRETQDEGAEREDPEPVQHHHQDLLPGRSVWRPRDL